MHPKDRGFALRRIAEIMDKHADDIELSIVVQIRQKVLAH